MFTLRVDLFTSDGIVFFSFCSTKALGNEFWGFKGLKLYWDAINKGFILELMRGKFFFYRFTLLYILISFQ